MVARAHGALKRWPRFNMLPVITAKAEIRYPKPLGPSEAEYHAAVYGLCAQGELIGRDGDGNMVGQRA